MIECYIMMEIWKLTVDCIEYREIGGVSCLRERGVACTEFLTAITMAQTILKNDNTKTKRKRKYFKKREINENENTMSLTKTITKTKIESKTKLTLNSIVQ